MPCAQTKTHEQCLEAITPHPFYHLYVNTALLSMIAKFGLYVQRTTSKCSGEHTALNIPQTHPSINLDTEQIVAGGGVRQHNCIIIFGTQSS